MEYVSALKLSNLIVIIECLRAYCTRKLLINLHQAIRQIAEIPRRQPLHRRIGISFSLSLRYLILLCIKIEIGFLIFVPIGPVVLADQAHLLALSHLVRVVALVHQYQSAGAAAYVNENV